MSASSVPVEWLKHGSWQLHPDIQEPWRRLEIGLQHVLKKFLDTHYSLFSIDYQPHRRPFQHGYLQPHRTAKFATLSTIKSQCAFLPFIRKLSFQLARVPTQEWEKVLLSPKRIVVHPLWVEDMK